MKLIFISLLFPVAFATAAQQSLNVPVHIGEAWNDMDGNKINVINTFINKNSIFIF